MSSTAGYTYGLLLNDISPEAQAHNSAWLGPTTLGLEVTASSLAKRCGLGNTDPQHTGSGGSSAIEEALTLPLPPRGTKLVTMRSDKDSVGAMAILTLRAQDMQHSVNKELVSWIGALDRHGFEEAARLHSDLAEMFAHSYQTNALDAIAKDFVQWPDMTLKVFGIMDILTGRMPAEEVREIVRSRKQPSHGFTPEMHGPENSVAFILAPGEYDYARRWGSKRYPVTVVYDPEYRTPTHEVCSRYTIIQQTGKLDMPSVRVAMNQDEARERGISLTDLQKEGSDWGGPPNILSSPQGKGRSPAVSKKTVLRNVIRCLIR